MTVQHPSTATIRQLKQAAATESTVSVRVRRQSGEYTVVFEDGDRDALVCRVVGDDLEFDQPEAVVSGPVVTFVQGISSSRDYLVLQDARIEAVGEPAQCADDEDENDTTTENGDSSRTNPPVLSGKRVRKDGPGGERISGWNPHNDPDRIKDTGLHQGGG